MIYMLGQKIKQQRMQCHMIYGLFGTAMKTTLHLRFGIDKLLIV